MKEKKQTPYQDGKSKQTPYEDVTKPKLRTKTGLKQHQIKKATKKKTRTKLKNM
jgi:hypothetical protein